MATKSKQIDSIFAVVAIFLLTGALTPLLQSSSIEEAELTEGSFWMQLQWSLIYLITFILLLRNDWSGKLKFFAAEKWIFALLLTAFLSFLWSDFPGTALRRTIGIFGSTFFGYYLAVRFTLKEALRLLSIGLMLTLLASIVFRFIAPDLALMSGEHDGALRGVFLHKNITGRIALIFALVVSSRFLVKEISILKYFLFLSLAFIIIILSGSFTALAVLILIHLILFSYTFVKKLELTKYSVIGLLLFVFLPAIYLFIALLPDILGYFGRDLTLTGRTFMWYELIIMIQKKPLLGYGYGSFWLGMEGPSGDVYRVFPWAAPHAHNGYLELFLNGGVVLFVFFIISFFVNIKRIGKLHPQINKKNLSYLALAYLSFYFIYNFSESLIMVQNNIFWVIYVFITISLYAWHKSEIQLKVIK